MADETWNTTGRNVKCMKDFDFPLTTKEVTFDNFTQMGEKRIN
jgi:hypothetical protein